MLSWGASAQNRKEPLPAELPFQRVRQPSTQPVSRHWHGSERATSAGRTTDARAPAVPAGGAASHQAGCQSVPAASGRTLLSQCQTDLSQVRLAPCACFSPALALSGGRRGRTNDHFSCYPGFVNVTPQQACCPWQRAHFLGSWIGLEMQEGFQTPASTLHRPLKKSHEERAVTVNLGQ